jgi:molybdopterin-binding protein
LLRFGRDTSAATLWQLPPSATFRQEARMEISARNQLKGKVKQVTPGAVMSEVVVDIGGQEVVSMISKASVERLGLEPGGSVVAIIKATDVMIGK